MVLCVLDDSPGATRMRVDQTQTLLSSTVQRHCELETRFCHKGAGTSFVNFTKIPPYRDGDGIRACHDRIAPLHVSMPQESHNPELRAWPRRMS